jgi:hypothetical protein
MPNEANEGLESGGAGLRANGVALSDERTRKPQKANIKVRARWKSGQLARTSSISARAESGSLAAGNEIRRLIPRDMLRQGLLDARRSMCRLIADVHRPREAKQSTLRRSSLPIVFGVSPRLVTAPARDFCVTM